MTAEELQAYIVVFAKLAGVSDSVAVSLRNVLKRLFPSAQPSPGAVKLPIPKRQEGRLDVAGRVDYGFDERVGALWINRDYLPLMGIQAGTAKDKAKAQRNFFETGQKLHRAFMEFIQDTNGFAAWHRGEIAPRIKEHDSDFALLRDLVGERKAKGPFRCRGAVVVGAEEPFIWIGVTHDRALMLERDGNERARQIRQLVAGLEIPLQATGWVDSVTFSHGFDHAAREVVRSMATVMEVAISSEVAADYASAVSLNGREGDFLFSYSSDLKIDRQCLDVLSYVDVKGLPVDYVVLVTARLLGEVEDEIVHALRKRKDLPARILVVDREMLRSRLVAVPWVLNDLLPDLPLRIIRATPERVQETFAAALSPVAQATQNPMHPAVRDVTTLPPRLALVGRAGSGKTVAVAQLLARHWNPKRVFAPPRLGKRTSPDETPPDLLAIIAEGGIAREDLDLVTSILRTAVPQRTVLVIDDLDARESDTLKPLLAVQERLGCPIITTYRTEDAPAIQAAYRRLFERYPFEERTLDKAPRTFLEHIANRWREPGQAPGVRGSFDAIIRATAAWDNTPATLLLLLKQHAANPNLFAIAKAKPSAQRWLHYLDTIRIDDPGAGRMLLLLAACRAITMHEVNEELITTVYAVVFKASIGDAHLALGTLQRAGVLTRSDGIVRSLRAASDPRLFELREGQRVTAFVGEVADAILAHPHGSEHRQALHRVAGYYRTLGKDDERRALLERIRDEYPEDERAATLLRPPMPRPAPDERWLRNARKE